MLKPNILDNSAELNKSIEWHHCDKCDFKTEQEDSLTSHKEIHLPHTSQNLIEEQLDMSKALAFLKQFE